MEQELESAVRQRQTAKNGLPRKRSVSWSSEVLIREERRQNRSHTSLPWYLVILYLAILGLLCGIALYLDTTLPAPVTDGPPNRFHASKARSHMEDLTSLGIRHVGGKANEVHAKNLIVTKLEEIKQRASPNVELDISVQTTSGTFYVNFLSGITHIYQNVTNIVARISRKGSSKENAFMVNAHYDSALGTVAASDDAISCGTMLETLRCLASDPDPMDSDNAIIFLFNGAEETFLQASHGFITQHPWAKTIRAFLNLEAAGAGGKEIVFQTGPDHPWLARLYSRVVPYPHASVMAQEIFQCGVIPSDTDFRIFRDHGNIPGIDVAYYVNGYVYHTEYDVPSAIPDGSIQRAGDNVLALLQAVVDSPYLSNPSAEDLVGKNVFFDILGLLGVVYPEKVAIVINMTLVLLVAVLMIYDLDWSNSVFTVKPTPRQLLMSVCVLLLSWLLPVLVTLGVGGVMTVIGRSMTWFAHPLLIGPLYVVPALLSSAVVHEIYWRNSVDLYSTQSQEKSSFLAVQLVWTVSLMILTCLRVCTAFIVLISVLSQVLFRTVLLEKIIYRELTPRRFMHFVLRLAYTLCSAYASGFPAMVLVLMNLNVLRLFVPLMGRTGAIVPPDLVIGGIVGVLVVLGTPYCVCVVVYSASKVFKKWAAAILLLVFVLSVLIAAEGVFHPYSVADKHFPRPKRLFLVHTDRRFRAMDGTVTQEDSKVFIYPFDYLGIAPIAEVTPLFQSAHMERCEGLYCREPVYVPVGHLINSYSLPATQKTGRKAVEIELVAMEKTSEHSKNFTFRAKFPVRTTAVLGVSEGLHLKAWSLESYVPAPNPCPGSHVKRGCYFIFQSRGFGEGYLDFWVETQGVASTSESLRLLLSAHYLDPPESQTPDLIRVSRDLPNWVTSIPWTASLDEWIF